MTHDPSAPSAEALAELAERYRATMANTFAALDAMVTRLADAPRARAVIEPLRRELHRLHGTAGSFGYIDAGRLAAAMEERAIRWCEDPSADDGHRADLLERFVVEARAAFSAAETAAPHELPARPRVLLVGLPSDTASALRREGTLRGVLVESMDAADCTASAIAERAPRAVITSGTTEALRDTARAAGAPLIDLPRADDLARAAGDNGSSSLPEPLDASAVFDQIERGTEQHHVAEAVSHSASSNGAGEHQNGTRASSAPDILVVEDDRALAEMLAYGLAAGGFAFRVFNTGPEALEALLAMDTGGRRPLVILDVDLPGLDGHSLHERLRVERPGVFDVVFTTVHASEGEQVRAINAGALDYVVKPLSLRVLLAKIPRWLDRSRTSRA